MDIEVQILNKVITLKEPSFNDYKSLVKNLQTTVYCSTCCIVHFLF